MAFTLIYLAAILLPGILITRLLSIRNQLVLFSVSFSLTYFTLLLLISIAAKINAINFSIIYISGIALLFGLNIKWRNNPIKVETVLIAGYLSVLISVSIYLFFVGFYNELPSDVYKHLEYFKSVAEKIESGQLEAFKGLAIFSKNVQYWYHLPTLITASLGIKFLTHVEVFAAINVIVLLICIYEFSYWLFKPNTKNKIELYIICFLSVFFFATQFGINVFAFIRYYSIAPTILNYAIYLTAIVCLFNYYRLEFGLVKFLLVSGLLFLTAFLIHGQEALFIGIIYAAVTLIVLLNHKITTLRLASNTPLEKLPSSLFPLAIFGALITALIYFYVINQVPFERINKPKIIDIAKILELGEDYFILNPRFQFYTVLTHWGLYIYILYILFYKKYFTNQLFLLAGMLIPALTIFNPFFTNFFLRVGYSDVLWRFLYMLPLYLVAARLVTGLCFNKTQSSARKTTNCLIALSIFVLLFPINFSSVSLPYSRIYSLGQPHYQARASYWQDMLDYLQNLPEQESIITDPVTGYLINSMTKHHNRSYKFYKWRMKDTYIFENYDNQPFKKYHGKIFIINQRKGMSTKIAKLAQHWPAHALKLTNYYNEKLIRHLEEESDHFDLLWEAEDIKIYRINY